MSLVWLATVADPDLPTKCSVSLLSSKINGGQGSETSALEVATYVDCDPVGARPQPPPPAEDVQKNPTA